MKLIVGIAMLATMCAAADNAATGAVKAEGAESESAENTGWNYAFGEGLTFGERKIVSAEAGVAIDSKYLSYGLADNKDPIVTPRAAVSFFDWLTFDVASIFNVTKYGRHFTNADGERDGYGNRAGRYTEIDSSVLLGHSFGPDDFSFLPTTVEFEFGYMNEYHPRSMGHGSGEFGSPSQFVTFEISLPDLWLEPDFYYERDIQRDEGTYLNLELGHTFALIDGEGEDDDPVLALRPSVGQGFGNSQRVKGYLTRYDRDEALDHAGLMDTNIKLELTWNIMGNLSFSGYVAYYDFLFDREIRDASRAYEFTGHDDDSWKFIGGLALTLGF